LPDKHRSRVHTKIDDNGATVTVTDVKNSLRCEG